MKILITILKFILKNWVVVIFIVIATLPISIFTFKTFSVWAVVANTLVLPVIESTMLFGALGLVLSSSFLMYIVDLQLKYVEIVVRLIGASGVGYWNLIDGKAISIVISVCIILFCIYYYPVGDEDSNYYLKIYS